MFIIGTWVVFLIVTIAASRLALLMPMIGLPLITGYLGVGMTAGPYCLQIVQLDQLGQLGWITQFALAFIAFSAGAELYLPELRSLFKSICFQTTSIAVVTFSLCLPVIYSLGTSGVLGWLGDISDSGCRWGISAIAASIMVARSPASAIAVAKELRAKGVFTSTLLGITVLCDVFVLILFSLSSSYTESECNGEGFSAIAIGVLVGTLFATWVLGWIVGKILILLMIPKRIPTRYLILPLGLGIFYACNALTNWSTSEFGISVNIEPLLLCIIAGYICTNQSGHRHRFIIVLQQAGPWIFLPFFTLAGASLNLSVMASSIGFACIIVLFRGFCIFLGSFVGGLLARQEMKYNLYMWMTLLTQAGVSLGLASEVGMTFSGWGRNFQTSIISVVLINQVVGPILFKIAIRRIGEAGKGLAEGIHDLDAEIPSAMIIGTTAASYSVAMRLLEEKWNVRIVARTKEEADIALQTVKQYAIKAREAIKSTEEITSVIVTKVAEPVDQFTKFYRSIINKFSGGSATRNASQANESGSGNSDGAATGSAGVDGTSLPPPINSSQSWQGSGSAHVQLIEENDTKSDAMTSNGDNPKTSDPSNDAPALKIDISGTTTAEIDAAQKHHDEHHEFVWHIEDHITVEYLMEADTNVPSNFNSTENPFRNEVSIEMNQLGIQSRSNERVADPIPRISPWVEYEARFVQLVSDTNTTLKVVIGMLPSDDDNIGVLTAVTKIIKSSKKGSAINSLRLLSSCTNASKIFEYEAIGITPLHEFSLFTTASCSLATVLPGKPAILLQKFAGNDELTRSVYDKVVGPPSLWEMLGRALTDTKDRQELAYASTVILKKRFENVNNSSNEGDSSVSRRLMNTVDMSFRLSPEQVTEVDRDHYLSQIGSITEQTSQLEDLFEKNKTGEYDNIEMFNAASAILGDDDQEKKKDS